jgi:hypothetical protein
VAGGGKSKGTGLKAKTTSIAHQPSHSSVHRQASSYNIIMEANGRIVIETRRKARVNNELVLIRSFARSNVHKSPTKLVPAATQTLLQNVS